MKKLKFFLLITSILIFTTACSNCSIKVQDSNQDTEQVKDKFSIAVNSIEITKTFDNKTIEFRQVWHSGNKYKWSLLMPVPYGDLQQDVINQKLDPDLPDLVYILDDAMQTISFKKYDISSFSAFPIKYFAQMKKKSLEDNFDNVTMKEIDIEGRDAWYYTYTRKHMSYKTVLFNEENMLFTITYDYLTVINDVYKQVSDYSLSTISFK